MFVHIIDILPFMMGSLVILIGSRYIKHNPLQNSLIIFTTFVYLVAQSSWFSSWMSGNEWGRDIANYIWFFFNTTVLGLFAWMLYKSKEK